ncbi:MAG TPA: hypothetical protein VE074_11040 [Jatrophihabitantaceae bacterium]|nr:hypothetical protein [Jatrophihabitantaceae bacterium]
MTYPSDPSNEPGSGYPGGYPSSYPSSYPASYPASGYPAFPGGQDESRLRGRRPIQVGGILLIVGVVLLIVGAFVSDRTAQGKVNGFQRVAVKDSTGTINLKGSGGYIAYYESDSLNRDTRSIPLVGVTLTNTASRQTISLDTTYGNQSGNKIKYLYYDHDGHKGLALWQFHIDQPGSYSVELQPKSGTASDAEMAFGRSIATSQAVGAAIVVAGVLLLLAGLILLVVGLVKRRRHKRQLRSAPPGYGGFGGVQPAGWPQPGGMQSWPPASGQPQQPPNDAPGWPPPPDQAGR